MDNYTGFLICSDIDGTLYHSGRYLSECNRSAIAYYTAMGGLFTVATGRTPHELSLFDHSILSAPIIASSGSLILDHQTGSVLADDPFDAEGYTILREIYRDYPSVIGVFAEDNHTYPQVYRESGGSIGTLFDSFPDPWHKAILLENDAASREKLEQELTARYGGSYVFDSAWSRSVEMHKGDKGTGVRRLRKLLGARAQIVICVGDHTNDIPMLRAADIGCAVSNALDITKREADHVIVSNDEDAIAYIIKHAEEWAKEKNLL